MRDGLLMDADHPRLNRAFAAAAKHGFACQFARLTLEADTEHKPELIFSGNRSYQREFGSVAAGYLFYAIDSTIYNRHRFSAISRDAKPERTWGRF
jgi:hypothetical protein